MCDGSCPFRNGDQILLFPGGAREVNKKRGEEYRWEATHGIAGWHVRVCVCGAVSGFQPWAEY